MSLLLRYDADPNNMDITGRIHYYTQLVVITFRLILEADGHPNPTMPNGVFRSSPLTAAGFAGMSEMFKLLLDFEINLKVCNPEGLTATHSVARTRNVDCALLLHEFGADMNAVSSNEKTSLTIAIIHNNHSVLRLFTDRN
jgi:ankyrin repeat protein